MLPPAPVLNSVYTGVPRSLDSCSDTSCASGPIVAPGAKGTTSLMGWSGNAAWAGPCQEAASAANANAAQMPFIMVFSSLFIVRGPSPAAL
ncbi:Uncharacterised protein [Bordetella pertussis]|nr:Uncharacterised protein [Bordetella pertussis]CFV99490.1 Uncharacterised protein [Bordetella pertussis]